MAIKVDVIDFITPGILDYARSIGTFNVVVFDDPCTKEIVIRRFNRERRIDYCMIILCEGDSALINAIKEAIDWVCIVFKRFQPIRKTFMMRAKDQEESKQREILYRKFN